MGRRILVKLNPGRDCPAIEGQKLYKSRDNIEYVLLLMVPNAQLACVLSLLPILLVEYYKHRSRVVDANQPYAAISHAKDDAQNFQITSSPSHVFALFAVFAPFARQIFPTFHVRLSLLSLGSRRGRLYKLLHASSS